MGEMVELRTEFPQRTLVLLQEYEGLYSETLLLNCLTGLLVLPKERGVDLSGVSLEGEPVWGLQAEFFEVRCRECGLQLCNVIRQLRNSVAHARVEAVNDGALGRISGFIFRDSGFIANIPVEDLKVFTISLAEYYLEGF
ncbi:MAG: HEPN family nuclease [Halodesulfovibrio sp.]|uniref:HEPN family nuclease n=1 Tax=Halodesulfovibrio sp. TaxID=1912772 RepID=UPI00359EF0A8